MSVVITEIYGNKEKTAEHSKNGSLVVWGQKSTVLKRILACLKFSQGCNYGENKAAEIKN